MEPSLRVKDTPISPSRRQPQARRPGGTYDLGPLSGPGPVAQGSLLPAGPWGRVPRGLGGRGPGPRGVPRTSETRQPVGSRLESPVPDLSLDPPHSPLSPVLLEGLVPELTTAAAEPWGDLPRGRLGPGPGGSGKEKVETGSKEAWAARGGAAGAGGAIWAGERRGLGRKRSAGRVLEVFGAGRRPERGRPARACGRRREVGLRRATSPADVSLDTAADEGPSGHKRRGRGGIRACARGSPKTEFCQRAQSYGWNTNFVDGQSNTSLITTVQGLSGKDMKAACRRQ